MAFGIDSGISRNTNNTVTAAEKIGTKGEILEMHTHGGAEEVQEEVYSDSFTNEATNGQVSDPDGTGVVTAHNLIEVNNDYARANKTTRKPLDLTTTTT